MAPIRPGTDKTRDENVDILFRALRDPSNRSLLPQIKRALLNAGYSEQDIMFYEITGKHRDQTDDIFKDIEKEMQEVKDAVDGEFSGFDTLRQHVKHMKRRRSHALRNVVVGFILIFSVLAILTILSMNGEDKSVPPPMTESSTVLDGDKL